MMIDDLRRRIVFDSDASRSRTAAETALDPGAHGLSHCESHRLGRVAQPNVSCTREAPANSGLDLGAVDPARPGVSVESAVGVAITLPEDRQTPARLHAANEEIPHSSCQGQGSCDPHGDRGTARSRRGGGQAEGPRPWVAGPLSHPHRPRATPVICEGAT